MQHYLIVWSFPTVDGAWESCPGFAEYINAGAPGDCFEGFELKYRAVSYTHLTLPTILLV